MIVYFSSLPIASVEFLRLRGKPGMTMSSMIRIGLSYEPRTQRPLTPREARAAKPCAKRGVLQQRVHSVSRSSSFLFLFFPS